MKRDTKYVCDIICSRKKDFPVPKSTTKYTAYTLKCVIFILIVSTKNVNASEYINATSSGDFVARCRRDCVIKRDVVVCGKYRVAKWLNEVIREKELSYGPFRVIKIPSTTQESIFPRMSNSRGFKFGVTDTVNFMRDLAEDLFKKRAIVYTYEPSPIMAKSFGSGPMILDEDELAQMQRGQSDEGRLFKKKKAIIIPLLILLNLIKIKLLVIPILLGVHLIKKLIIIGGLFVPGILSKLRICKVNHGHPFHSWATAAEAPVDYPTAYGHDDPGWAHRNDLLPGVGGYGGPYHPYHSASPYYRPQR
ncbi:uncharacterized protein [Chelonus insularis]|uniref:uncharacterized protein n=1 Tax=Chelonus insularis TaxID=460826 RepID=UPI00158BB156|nr:uncharacterized protein LOC118073467 [Chelonus insularis]